MASEQQKELRKGLLKKDKLELVKILKKKKLPTNGSKADMVSRILENDEKTGGKMARKATTDARDDNDETEGLNDEDDPPDYEEEEEEAPPPKKKKQKRKKSSNAGGGRKNTNNSGGGGGGGAAVDCGNCGDCGGCSVSRGGGVGGIAQIFTAIAIIGQLIIGIIQFINLVEPLDNVCDDTFMDCVGGALIWPDDTSDVNGAFGWRRVFTFVPSIFFENWTPVLFALLGIMQMFSSTKWDLVSGSWLKAMFFLLVMALFAGFPYSGKVGIIFGFVQSFAAFFCLVCACMRDGGAPFITFGY